MTTLDFNHLTKAAEEAGFDVEDLPADTYDAEIASANYSTKSNGKSQFGFRFKVLAGPLAGKGVWMNVNVPHEATAKSAESYAKSCSIFLAQLKALGFDQQRGAGDPDGAAKALIGRAYNVSVSYRPKQGGGNWTDVKVNAALAAAPATTMPPAQYPPQGQAAPAGTPAWQTGARPV